MRMTLLNQRPELGSCKTQKTKRQNVLNRILLALFAILFLPIGAWAEDYFTINYTVNNSTNQIWVSDENNNLGDILGDGKMSYNATNNILTLNGIDLSCSGDHGSQVWNSFITFADWNEDFNHVIVQLVGQNFLEVDDLGRFFDGAGITFITDEANPGSLTITTADGWNGYMFVNYSTPITPTYNNGLCLIQNGNTYAIQVPVSYNITVAGTAVTSANASNVLNDDYSSVSYNATTNTLTLKGVHLDSATGDNNISATSALTIHLEGYSTVGTINVNDVTFTTNVSLPGRLRYTSISGNTTYENGLQSGTDSNNKNIIYSSSTNPYIIYATGYKFKDYDDTFYYWYDNGDIQGWSNEDYAAASLDVSSDLYVVGSQNNAKIDYFKVSTTSTNPTSCYLYPASLDDMNLVNKVYFLFDWGTCTNKNVKIQVRGLKSDFTNDGTYSNEVSLPSNGGLVEIPLTGTVNSYYFQIYFSSTTDGFSFIPISVGFQKMESYGLTVGGVAVTNANASNIFGQDYATASYDNASNTLTLSGCQYGDQTSSFVSIGGSLESLTVHLVGYNQVGYDAEKLFSSTNACTINITTDATVPGKLEYNGESTDLTDKVTLNFGTSGLGLNVTTIEATNGTSDISYFGIGQFYDVPQSDYPYCAYTNSIIWYFSNAAITNGNNCYPPTVNSSAGTTGYVSRMKSSGSAIIKSLIFQYVPVSGETINVALKSLDGGTTYATGTLANGLVTLTPNTQVTYDDVCLTFTSESAFSFVPLAVKTIEPESYDITVAGVQVDEQNASGITGNGITGTVTFTPAGDTTPATLTLSNATITGSLQWNSPDDLTIVINGECSITNNDGDAIELIYGGSATPTLTFTKATNATTCTLVLTPSADRPSIDDECFNISYGEGVGCRIGSTSTQGSIVVIGIQVFSGGGNGSSSTPYVLQNATDLQHFASYYNNGWIDSHVYVKLGNNIDCSNSTITSIGSGLNPFAGTFLGSGNTISNLTIQDGLFHTIDGATISNLTLSGCTVTGATSAKAAGIAVETAMNDNTTIQNCSVVNSTIACKADANNPMVGGIVAQSYGATITGCTIDNVQIKAETTYSGTLGVVGGIVGNASGGEISSCVVKNGSKITDYNANGEATLHAGAIVGEYAGTTLSANYYHYDVIVETLKGTDTANKDTKSDYTQRGTGHETVVSEVSYYDVTENNGAVMYTKVLTVGINSECNFYEPSSDNSNGILAIAPGQTVNISLSPENGKTISAASLVYTPTGGTEQTVNLENVAVNSGEYSYSFAMPDANATLNATIAQAYDLWIGETQVTSTNAANVLGDGKVSFTESGGQTAAPTYTLTLNGAALTAPVKVGLANLTIDVQGSNTITTNTTCIQNTAIDFVPSLTFKSSSDVVGSLTLTDTDEEGINGVISSSYYGHFTISKELALIMLRYGNYTSNTYYFSAGEVHNAQLVPSYGVQVGDMQVYEGNATNVLGDGKVSFDKSSHTLTLNNASGIEAISTTLSTLDIDLVGSNSLYRSSDGSIFESASGEAVTINLKSTGATKGSLTMEAPKSNGATLKGDNVTLTPVDPIVLLSSDVTENKGTLVYGVSYDLTVSGVSVTSANASAIQTGAEFIAVEDGGSVTFDTATSTLTLNNAHLKHGIVSGLDNLKIRFQGTNKINSDSQVDNMDIQGSAQSNAISSSLETATLTFEKTGNGTIELYAKTFSYDPVISGFASVNYGSGDYQCYVQSSVPSYYDGTGKRLVNFYDVKGVTNATITSVASYPLWIGSGNFIQVTSANSEGITGTAIESGNVSFVPSDNKLKLKNAAITSKILSGLTNLTIDVEGNCSVIIPDSGSVVRSVVAGALTITKTGTNASLRLKNVVQDTYYPVIERFSSLTYTDFNLDTETSATYGQFGLGMNGDNAQIFDVYGLYNPDETESYKKGITSATFTTATLYPLWVGGVHVTSDIASSITGGAISVNSGGSVSYDAENNILTLNNVNFYTGDSAPIIESGLDALTVNVVGPVLFNFNDVNPAYVFKSTNANGVLTFTTTDASTAEIQIPRGIAAGAFTGFKTVSYKNGLALRTVAGDVPKYYIAPMVAPSFGAFSLNAETGDFTGTITTTYNYEGATIKYSIDYADDHEDVSNAVYGTSVVMKGPGTLTAYIAVGESTSPMTTAKWFAFTSHEIQGIKGQTSVAVPAVIPTIATTDNITVTYSSNAATIASISEGNITFNGVGATTIRGSFTTTGTVPFTVLNTGTYFDEIAVTVVPPAPVIAYDDTKTYLSTDKIEISLDPTYAAAPSGSNTIYYSWAENPTTGTVYPEGGVAVQTGTLTAWVVATVSDVNYESAKATQPFTVLVDPELAYKQGETSVTTATWTIDGTNNTALPVLQNTHSVAVTYASDNTAVATVANDGTVTVIGAGTAKITATAAATDVSAADEAYYTLTVNRQLNVNFSASNEWATYYGTENLATPTGLKAYQVTAVNGSTVTTSEIGYIPANTAVLLQNIEGKTAATNTIASAYTGATSTFPNNLLIGSTEAVGVSSINGGTVYVLYNDMFKRATSGTIPANRAYLVISGAAPARLNIVHGGDETGIDNIRMDEPNDSWYTIDGRKLNGQPQRAGFYIRNGKKVYKR